MKTFTHKLTDHIYTPVKISSEDGNTGVVFFVKETGKEKFLTNHQIERLLKKK